MVVPLATLYVVSAVAPSLYFRVSVTFDSVVAFKSVTVSPGFAAARASFILV